MRTREIKALNAEYLSTLLKQMQEPEIAAERFDRLAKLYAAVRSGKISKATAKPVPPVKSAKRADQPELSDETKQILAIEESRRHEQRTEQPTTQS